MLVGREAECRELARLLRSAADGKSGSLVIRGEAGMGKTALLAYAAHRAERSFLILSARGVQSESELAFAGLVGLCRPLLGHLDRLPDAQRGPLKAAIALSSGSVADRFAVYAAFLSLLGAAAEDRPVLVIVDDLQWLDRSSAEAVLFVARRLGRDRIAILAAARLPNDRVDVGAISQMRLGGLSREAGVRLLRGHDRSVGVAPDVAERLVDLTRGAPLALVEVPSLLSEAQLRGDAPLPEPLPAGSAVQEAFRREISRQSRRCRDGLLILAADDGGALDAVQDALALSGLSLAALAPAEGQGLVHIEGDHVEFRHPLLRSVVYHGSKPVQRRSAHGALARAYATRDDIRFAWHQAAAAPGPDESIASALEAAAADAASRGSHGSAAMALERAAELTPQRAAQARRRYQAGVSASLSGESGRAQRNLDAALRLTTDPLMRADIQRARGLLMYTSGSLVDAYELLVAEAVRVQDRAPKRAVAMLTDACTVCSGSADVRGGERAARMAMAIAPRADRDAQLLAALALAQPLILGGRTKEAQRLLKAWKKDAAEYFRRPDLNPFHPVVGVAYTYQDLAFGRQLLDNVHETARTRSPEMLPQVLATLTHVDLTFGDWPLALAHAAEGSELASVLGQEGTRAFALATLATVEAGMGREEARPHAEQAIELAARTAARSMQAYGCHAIGLLELGRGRVEEAIAAFEETARLMREWGIVDPLLIPWMPNLVEAYVRAGQLPQAKTLVAELTQLATRTGVLWSEAAAARCAGLVADDFDGPFRAALDLYDRLPDGFDRGRTELAYAERLRRSGRRRDARPHLHTAIEVFRRLGARPWQQRAETELGGTAEHIHSRSDPMQELSPQELQVALLVGSGATNREAAAALYVTAKTVEYHLGHVYQKLGVRSRTELAVLLASRSKDGTPASGS